MKYLLYLLLICITQYTYAQEDGELKLTSGKLQQVKDSLDRIGKKTYKKELKTIRKYMSNDNYVEAIKEIYKVLQKEPNIPHFKDLIRKCNLKLVDEQVLKEADEFYLQREYTLAKKFYEKYLEKYPNDKYCKKQLKKIAKVANKT